MPTTVQEFVAKATEKGAKDLLTVAQSVPADKRTWQPEGKGRSVVDQLAECALMNGVSVPLIKDGKWIMTDWDAWTRDKEALMEDWDTVVATLEKNTAELVAAIRAVPTESLDTMVELPWETTDMSHIINYCFWNMAYHEGQITYISLML